MSHTIYCHTNYGLCNRLACILNGLFLRSNCPVNSKVSLIWVPDRACKAHYSDIFETDPFLNIYSTYEETAEILSDSLHVPETNTTLLNTFTPLYRNAGPAHDREAQRKYFKNINQLTPLKPISDEINDFAKTHNIDKSVIGLHLRGWEILSKMHGIDGSKELYLQREEAVIKKIDECHKNGTRVFFISDIPDVEERLRCEFSNVIIRKKSSSVIYKTYEENNNIVSIRSKQQVVDAYIDLMLVGRTTFYKTSGSTGTFSLMCNEFSEHC